MKTIWVFVIVMVLVISFHAFRVVNSSAISGKVYPEDAGQQVMVIQGKDSVKTTPDKGLFMLQVKPGLYKVLVLGRKPYKELIKNPVSVTEGKINDLGEIKLIQ